MKLILSPPNDEFEQLKTKSPEEQRYLFYSGKIDRTYFKATLSESEEKIVYSERTYQIMFNKKIYSFSKTAAGFSFNKKEQKLNLWPNTALYNLGTQERMRKVFTALGKEWMEHIGWNLFLSKGMLEKILQNKITNPREAAEYFIKMNRFPKTTSIKFLLAYFKAVTSGDRFTLFKVREVAKDINHFLQLKGQETSRHFEDILKQALILDEKIDFTWSAARFNQTHDDWTNKIMEKEMSFVQETVLDYNEVKLPTWIEVIKSQKRLFAEGRVMKHCIYTNYRDEWERQDYIVLHSTCPTTSELVTIGLSRANGNFEVDQIYKKGNKVPSEKTIDFYDENLEPLLPTFNKMVKRKSTRVRRRPEQWQID